MILTSPSLLVEGVRSGSRRRNAATPSPLAGGGIEPEPRRVAPVWASAALCCQSAGYLASPPWTQHPFGAKSAAEPGPRVYSAPRTCSEEIRNGVRPFLNYSSGDEDTDDTTHS